MVRQALLVREALQETTAYQGLRAILVLPTDLCALVAQHVGTRETVKYESGYKPALEVHHVTPGSLAVSLDSNPNNPGQNAFGVLFNPEDMPPTVKNSSMYEIITGKCRLHADFDWYPSPEHPNYDAALSAARGAA